MQPGASKGTLGIEICLTEILGRQKNKEMGGGIYLFVSRENKRIKPSKFSLIPKFSRGDTPDPR